MGEVLDALDPLVDNIPAVWDQFLYEFSAQFQDSQKEGRAWQKLENLQMKFPDIDRYISQFEELACQANYAQGNNETIEFFIRGLSRPILEDIMKAPFPHTYQEYKERAIDSTKSRQIIEALTGGWTGPPQRTNPFNNFHFQQNMGLRRSFFSQNQQNNEQWRNAQPPWSPFNLSNVPATWNNQLVPMDLSRTRTPNNYRGWGCGRWTSQARPAQTSQLQPVQTSPPRTTNSGNTSNACFQYGQVGHFARNCPSRQRANANLIDFDAKEGNREQYTQEDPQDHIVQMKAVLAQMSISKKAEMAQQMGAAEDFPTAWSDRHWLGKVATEMEMYTY